ncbi:hypothetical protein EJ110_NYTH14365 [Nymphaea thermarum]|nr:hypothetical protein EJ110_NYTH14365 [Nymphaea thermarum]
MDTLKVSLSKRYSILHGVSVWEWSAHMVKEMKQQTGYDIFLIFSCLNFVDPNPVIGSNPTLNYTASDV